MSVSIELPPQELAALRQITKLDDDAQAVTKAAQEFLRLSRLRELKAASGKIDFQWNWRELETLEHSECDFPI